MARKIKVDMTGVESMSRCAEGEHIARLKEINEQQASTGTDMLVGIFEVVKGSSKGAKVYENFPLSEKALWKLKGFLEAVGQKADGKMQLDLDKLVGKTCIISVVHDDSYNNQIRAKIQEFRKLENAKPDDADDDYEDEELDDDEDYEEPAPKKPAAPAKPKPAPPAKGKKAPPPPEDDEDEEDEWDDEDEDDEPAPPPKKGAKKPEPKKPEPKKPAPAAKGKKAPPPEDDDDDDDDWEDA